MINELSLFVEIKMMRLRPLARAVTAPNLLKNSGMLNHSGKSLTQVFSNTWIHSNSNTQVHSNA